MRHILVVCLLFEGCGSVMSTSDEDADAGADVGSDIPGEVPDAPVDVIEDAPLDEVSLETPDSSSDESADGSDVAPVDFTGPCLIGQDFESSVPMSWIAGPISLTDEVVHSGSKALKLAPGVDGTMSGTGALVDFDGAGLDPPYVVEGWIYWKGDLTSDEFASIMLLNAGEVATVFGEIGLRYTADHSRSSFWLARPSELLGTWEEARWMKVDLTTQCVGSSWLISLYLSGVKLAEFTSDRSVCGDGGGYGFVAGTLARPLYIDDLCIREWIPVS